MQRAKRPVVATVLAVSMLFSALLPVTAQARQMDPEEARPGEIAMVGDALLVRPAMLIFTAAGLVVYTASLPFSVLGGNVAEAGETLVLSPARATFLRCLGCTPQQHRRLKSEKERAASEKNND